MAVFTFPNPSSLVFPSTGGSGGAVTSVNSQTGVVVLDATDVGAASQALNNLVSPNLNADIVADSRSIYGNLAGDTGAYFSPTSVDLFSPDSSVSVTSGITATSSENIQISASGGSGKDLELAASGGSKIRFAHSTPTTTGYVWTATDTSGNGAWQAAGGGGANTTLSNLGITAINADLLFNKVNAQIKTQDNTVATQKLLLRTGDSSAAKAGDIEIYTGASATNFNTGRIDISTDSASGSGNSGAIVLSTGSADAGNGGDIELYASSSTSGTHGKILISGQYVDIIDGFTSASGTLRIFDDTQAEFLAFTAPTGLVGSVTWTLPAADATISGQVLQSDAAGTLSWATPSVGTLANDQYLNGRNSADNANIGIVKVDSANDIILGNFGNPVTRIQGDLLLIQSLQDMRQYSNTGIFQFRDGNVAVPAQIQLYSTGSTYASLTAAASMGSNASWVLPSSDGLLGAPILTDGLGNLTFAGQTDAGIQFPANATDPSTPAAGMVFFDTSISKLKVYNGSAWEVITSV